MVSRTHAKWTDAEDEIIRKHYSATTNDDMRAHLPGRTKAAISNRAIGLGVQKAIEHRLEMARISFQKGRERRGVWPVGHIRGKGRNTMIKVAQPDVWKRLQVHIWEQANGPVPAGMIVVAKDGDASSTELPNLCLRTRAENQIRTHHNHRDLPEGIVDILHLQNEIKKTIKRKRKP